MTTQVHLFVSELNKPDLRHFYFILFYLAAKKGNICCLQVPTFEFGSHNYIFKLFQT